MTTQTIQLHSIRRNRELIFIETIRELNSRKNIRTPYNLARQSAMLRFLVIDGSKFFNEINKPFKLKLGSKISTDRNYGNSMSSGDVGGSAFEILLHKVNENGEFFTIPNFLKLPAIRIQDKKLKEYLDKNHIAEEYSIHDIIKLVANAHGGVHVEAWENIHPHLMTDATSPFNINSNSKLHDIIQYTSDFILKALDPLGETVFNNITNRQPTAVEATTTVYVKDKE